MSSGRYSLGVDLRPKQRKKRKQIYDGQVTAALATVWEIFDCPCGQSLKPILEVELDRLRDRVSKAYGIGFFKLVNH